MLPVQFYGRDDVVKAYDNLKVPRWAVFNGKTLNEKYEGDSLEEGASCLNQYLLLLERSRTLSVYTLKTYEDFSGKIKPSTECDRSFNFIVNDRESEQYQSRSPYYNLEKKLEAIEAKLAARDDDTDGEEEKVSGIEATLMNLLKIPEVQHKIGSVISGFLDKIIPMQTNGGQQQAQAIGSVPPDNADQMQKVQAALEILVNIDPNLGDNLLKIARIAQNDKARYFQLASFL